MDVPGLCVSLLVHMLILQSTYVQKSVVSCSVSLRAEPNKLQFFEYERLTLHCEGVSGSTGLKLLRQSKENLPPCDTKTTTTSTVFSCSFQNLYLDDSGEYWCESADGKRSNSFSISVSAGSVILESPALPVKEGEAVTLLCRNKRTPSNPSAEFYKNGLIFNHSSTGTTTLPSASKCDKGFYKCKIPDGRESAKSWLEVEGSQVVGPPSYDLGIVFRNIQPVMLMILLLLMLGLIHCCKPGDKQQQLRSAQSEMTEMTAKL